MELFLIIFPGPLCEYCLPLTRAADMMKNAKTGAFLLRKFAHETKYDDDDKTHLEPICAESKEVKNM